MKSILLFIDKVSEQVGSATRWLVVLLVAVISYEVVARHFFNSPTQWAHLTSMILMGFAIALGWSYTHRHHGHVRVDVFYGKFSQRTKAIVNVSGYIILFFPLLILLAWAAYSRMVSSWATGEVMMGTFWYPPAGPSRTVIFVGLVLLILQGCAHFLREVYILVKGRPYDV